VIGLGSRHRRAALVFLAVEIAFGQVVVTHALVIAGIFRRVGATRGLDLDGSFAITSENDDPSRSGPELSRLSALPGVSAAAWTSRLPFLQRAIVEQFTTGETFWHMYGTPSLAQAAGFELTEGRALAAGDERTTPRPVLMTQALASAVFKDKPALGQVVRSHATGRDMQVVGLLREGSIMPMLAASARNLIVEAAAPAMARHLEYLVSVSPAARSRFAAAAEAALGPSAGFRRIETLRALQERRQNNTLGTYMVVAAVILMVLGVVMLGAIGIASFLVAERMREIGVRRALGATRGDIARSFILENFALSTLGLLAGTGLSLALNQFLVQKWLSFAVLDFQHVFLGIILFWGTGLLASSIPALRASRVPPSVASRSV